MRGEWAVDAHDTGGEESSTRVFPLQSTKCTFVHAFMSISRDE
jgi:hypothetical protein